VARARVTRHTPSVLYSREESPYLEDELGDVVPADEALDEAQVKGWTAVSMKDDWRQVFPR
jgi:hypothetical protein